MKIGLRFNADYYPSRVNFVISFLNSHPYFNNHTIEPYGETKLYDTVLNYGDFEEDGLKIPKSKFIFSDQIAIDTYANQYIQNSLKIYSVEQKPSEILPFFTNSKYSFDWIEAIFFHISRYEEYYCKDANKDIWDNMNEDSQFLIKNGLHHEPQVDIILEAIVNSLGIELIHQKSVLCVTHDIDHYKKYSNPKFYFKSFLKEVIYTKNIVNPAKRIIRFKNSEDPFQKFDFLISSDSIEKKIYFLVGNQHEYDLRLPLDLSLLKYLIEKSLDKGYKIGIHPSYNSWRDGNLLEKEKEIIENCISSKVEISRQHYLHFDFSNTIEILESNGIKEDSTLGYNYHYGFRCGTGFKYNLYNFNTENMSNIIEDPMVLMDASLVSVYGNSQQKIEEAIRKFLNLNNKGRRININFHNSIFAEMTERGLDFMKIYHLIINTFAR